MEGEENQPQPKELGYFLKVSFRYKVSGKESQIQSKHIKSIRKDYINISKVTDVNSNQTFLWQIDMVELATLSHISHLADKQKA